MAAAAQVAAKMQASGIGKSEHLFFCFISTMNIYNSISCIDLFQDKIITQSVSHKEIPFANEIPSVYIPFVGMTQSLHLAVFAFNTSSNFLGIHATQKELRFCSSKIVRNIQTECCERLLATVSLLKNW